jgi:hypothetical protein
MTDQHLAKALAETSQARALELLAAAELASANDVLIARGLRDGAPSHSGTSSVSGQPTTPLHGPARFSVR